LDPVALRVFVYDETVARGRPPSCADIGVHFGISAEDSPRALAELKIGKTILVDPHAGEIWMAGPFSATETPYRVVSGDRAWWANCAWDMFGIVMIVGEQATIYTRCTDCSAPMTLAADPFTRPNEDAVVHFLVPAQRWYDDIGFT